MTELIVGLFAVVLAWAFSRAFSREARVRRWEERIVRRFNLPIRFASYDPARQLEFLVQTRGRLVYTDHKGRKHVEDYPGQGRPGLELTGKVVLPKDEVRAVATATGAYALIEAYEARRKELS